MSHHDTQEETFNNRLNLHLWSRLLRSAGEFRRELITLAVCAVITAGSEISLTLITKWMIDDVSTGSLDRSIWSYAGIYLGVILTMGFCIWKVITLGGIVSTGASHNIRRQAFARLQDLEFSYFDSRPAGWLITRLTSDCDRLARIIAWSLLDLFWGSLMVVFIGGALLILHWKLGLLVLMVVPPLILLSLVFQRKMLFSSRDVRKFNSMITANFNESITGTRTTKTLVREGQNLREFQENSGQMYTASIRNALQSALYLPVVFTLGAAATGLALWQGGLFNLSGAISLGTLIAFLSYTGQFFNPINKLAGVITELQSSQAAAERVFSLLDTEPKIRDLPEVAAMHNGDAGGIGEICFRNVSFEYEPGVPVLRGFSLTIRSGETIALVGPSGGGKSTIVNLAGRFYEPTEGEILIDGVDYRKRSLSWLQSNLGIVLQAPHLFNGTVRENIRYGRLEASDEEIEQAARLVNAHDFIEEMEAGYDTIVGEGGDRLSTGQKQLVSFARALLADPRIFIMDEATSSVDTVTENLIQRGLDTILRGRISFVIAHRLSTIRSADRILFIRAGQIVEEGNHRELLARRGAYYELYTRQSQSKRQEEMLGIA